MPSGSPFSPGVIFSNLESKPASSVGSNFVVEKSRLFVSAVPGKGVLVEV